jgi:hypothetical protein
VGDREDGFHARGLDLSIFLPRFGQPIPGKNVLNPNLFAKLAFGKAACAPNLLKPLKKSFNVEKFTHASVFALTAIYARVYIHSRFKEVDMAKQPNPYTIKLTESERAEIEAYAKRQGFRFLSDAIRSKMLELARQAEREAATSQAA